MEITITLLSILGYALVGLIFGVYYTNLTIKNYEVPKGKNISTEQIKGLYKVYVFIFGLLFPIFMIDLIYGAIKRRVTK